MRLNIWGFLAVPVLQAYKHAELFCKISEKKNNVIKNESFFLLTFNPLHSSHIVMQVKH